MVGVVRKQARYEKLFHGSSGVPKRSICSNMHEADSNAVVILVGNSSTHLENASMGLCGPGGGAGEGVRLDVDL